MDAEEDEDMRSRWWFRLWLVLLLATMPVLVGCPDDGDDGRDGVDGQDGEDGVDAAARPIPTLEGHTSATDHSLILAYDVQAAFNDDTFFWRVSYRGNEGKRHDYFRFTDGEWQQEGGDRRDAQASVDGDANQGSINLNSTIYEQRTSIMISDPSGAHPTDFDKFGCFVTCHDQLRHMPEWHEEHGEDGKYVIPSLVSGVEGDAEGAAVLDLWHWRGARSGPIERADDQWIEALTFVNVDEQDDSGRRGDAGAGVFRSQAMTDGHPDFVFDPATTDGEFAFNWEQFWLTPLYFITDPDATQLGSLAPTPTVMAWADAVALGYEPAEGDTVPRRVLRAGDGSHADITAHGTEFLPESGDGRLGVWHVQMQRLLDTGNDDDVALIPGNTYDVGFEVHLWEYTTRDHYVSFPMKLRLGAAVAAAAVAPLDDNEIVATELTGSGTFPLPDWDDEVTFPKTRIYLFQPGITSWEFVTGADASKVFFDPVAGEAVDQTHGGATAVSGATSACIDCHNVRAEDDRVPPTLNAGAMETLTRQRGGVWADTPVDNECGNEVVEGIEECDDGNTDAGDGCAADCTTELVEGVCGDGTLNTGEECDDGDTTADDGCSATCTVEEGFTCTGEPSVCTEGIDGAALFVSECGTCHTGNGLGTGTISDVTGATATAITDAIASEAAMSGIDLTAEEIQAIADAL
jgi:cysteine-rich repeat protein